MKFVELYNDYFVNIDSIFSIQSFTQTNQRESAAWQAQYDEMKQYYSSNMPPIQVGDEQITIDQTEEGIERYAAAVHNEIIRQIGTPPEDTTDYIIITTTGSKILITQEKYELIVSYIKSTNLLQQKLDKALKQ